MGTGQMPGLRPGDTVSILGTAARAGVQFVTGGWAKLDRRVNGHEWFHHSELAFVDRPVYVIRVR